ncbi:LacI family DNA-binding transcriptional regulator [Sinomonas sp. JGH33]|uniref:LacI family DNA-binding transcriptional regulator n=1 Tax=Sinomonas terricola TaxID=3110330 RepID=A0ABU5T368_9MICC|nr:LacI family DNA-binding transcriptional regulator [Sinomonas sp. JGH33]MEA5454010.1 LacI family DNA-binding transcriptional regulator [Sinomonas sp. JGH33]
MEQSGPETAQRPTVSSVAAHAGVSRQTVSNALNNPERLQPETLKRVLTAIEETGYVRSAAARQMRTARSGVIAYRLDPVRDGIGGAVLDTFLHALTAEAERRDYRVVLYTADSDEAELRQFSSLTQARAADAFVLVGTHRNDLRYRWLSEHGIPFSVFGRPWPEEGTTAAEPAHAWIDVDGAAGTAQAARHLLDLGHRNIAFVGWPAGSETGDERRRGWDEAMAAAGVGAAERRPLDSEQQDGILEGADAAARLLAGGATAFVCASDSLAVGAFSAVRAAGARAAVVGFDDSPTAAALGLSSIRQPLDDAAAWALASVLDQLDGRAPRERDARLLLPRLVVRESSQPPASATR